MKYLLPILLLVGCNSKKIISMDAGCIRNEMAQGTLGSSVQTDTYFLCETNPKTKVGFLVIQVTRDKKLYDELPYRLLDSLQRGKKYLSIDSSTYNWSGVSKEELSDMAIVKSRYFSVMDQFTEHVKCVVDDCALDTGIDYDTKLIYQ